MKPTRFLPGLLTAILLAVALSAPAQVDTKKSDMRAIGGGGSSGVGITPAPPRTTEKITKTVTYMALSEKRAWKSGDGKTIVAMLLAFDTDGKSAEEIKATPVTVIREGQVRLLKDNKEFILPLKRLSDPDQKFVRAILEKSGGREIPESTSK